MQARIDNPALTVPGALQALQKLGTAVKHADVPATTLYLIELRASQINGCSVCVNMHSREARQRVSQTSASPASRHGERRPTTPTPSAPPSPSPRPPRGLPTAPIPSRTTSGRRPPDTTTSPSSPRS